MKTKDIKKSVTFHLHDLDSTERPRTASKNRSEVPLMSFSCVSKSCQHVRAIMTDVSKISMRCQSILFCGKSQNYRNPCLGHSKIKGNPMKTKDIRKRVTSHLHDIVLYRTERPRTASKNRSEVPLMPFSCVSKSCQHLRAIMTDVSKISMRCQSILKKYFFGKS